jgi:hypothetical protein
MAKKKEEEDKPVWSKKFRCFLIAILIGAGGAGLSFGIEHGHKCRMKTFDEDKEEGSRGQLALMLAYLGGSSVFLGVSWAIAILSQSFPDNARCFMFCCKICTRVSVYSDEYHSKIDPSIAYNPCD